jgi:hypothetical protein
MKLRNSLLTVFVMLLGLAALAQNSAPKIEVAVDYSYARFNPAHSYVPNTYSLNGGGGSADYNFTKYVGVVAEFEGYSSKPTCLLTCSVHKSDCAPVSSVLLAICYSEARILTLPETYTLRRALAAQDLITMPSP